MPHFILIFLIFIISLSVIIAATGKIAFYGKDIDIDSQYHNADGDHIYYDRSLIEKKLFRKRFPHIKNIRTFAGLFTRKCE